MCRAFYAHPTHDRISLTPFMRRVIVVGMDGPEGSDTMPDVQWDILREGRAWGSEALERYARTPEKIELMSSLGSPTRLAR